MLSDSSKAGDLNPILGTLVGVFLVVGFGFEGFFVCFLFISKLAYPK